MELNRFRPKDSGAEVVVDNIHGMYYWAPDVDKIIKWVPTKVRLPDREPNARYSQVPCLVIRNGEVQILVFNHEHMVWDDADGDDFCCSIDGVSFWMPLPEIPK